MQHKAANTLMEQSAQLTDPSEPTKALVASVRRYQSFQNKLNARLERKPTEQGSTDFDNLVGPNDLSAMKDLLHRMETCAKACAQTQALPAEETRFVNNVLKYTDKVAHVPKDIEADEQATVMANDRQMTEQLNRSLAEQAKKLAAQNGGGPQL